MPIFRSFSLSLIALTLAACSRPGGTWQHYRISAVTEARDRGMTAFLHFVEAGNPLCEKQKSQLEELIKDPAFVKAGAYRVVWGSEMGLQQTFGVSQPCTLLIFKGTSLKTKISSDIGPELLKVSLRQGL